MGLEKRLMWVERKDKRIAPLDFYNQYYQGIGSVDLPKIDRIFYLILCNNNLIDSIPLRSIMPEAKKIATENEIVKIKKITKKIIVKKVPEISEIEEGDAVLESKWDISMKINLAPRYALKISKTPWKKDPIAYCLKHFPNLASKELETANRRFWKYLYRHKLLDIVPKKTPGEKSEIISAARKRDGRFGEDALAYYQKHYPGMFRGILKAKDPCLYQRLRRDGLIDELPMTIKTNKYSDPLEDYKKNCCGLTRGELKREYKGLYERLREDNLLYKVPL